MGYDKKEIQKAFKILKSVGWSFRLATVEEKRNCAKNHKKAYRGNSRAAKYSLDGQQNKDVYFNFKKDVFACFHKGQFDFFSSRREIYRFFRAELPHIDRLDLRFKKAKAKFENEKFHEYCSPGEIQ